MPNEDLVKHEFDTHEERQQFIRSLAPSQPFVTRMIAGKYVVILL